MGLCAPRDFLPRCLFWDFLVATVEFFSGIFWNFLAATVEFFLEFSSSHSGNKQES